MIIPHWYLLDYLTQYEGDRPQLSWDCNKMVNAVKGRPINGFVKIKVGNTLKRFEQDNINDLVSSLCATMGSMVAQSLIQTPSSIVPIPNSDMVQGSGDNHRIIKSAEMLLQGYEKYRAEEIDVDLMPVLRWTEPHEPASQRGGFRSPNEYKGKLILTNTIKRPVIVFDDVYTSGSQAKAVCDYLIKAGVDITAIVTVAKTVHEPSEHPISWRQSTCQIQEGLFGQLI